MRKSSIPLRIFYKIDANLLTKFHQSLIMISDVNFDQKSFYYIPKEYIPVLIKKHLFKNSEKAVKKFKNIKIPLYVLNDFELSTKKPPNSFIIFRSEIFKNVKNEFPNSTSRELSKIIGNLWNQMTKENKNNPQFSLIKSFLQSEVKKL